MRRQVALVVAVGVVVASIAGIAGKLSGSAHAQREGLAPAPPRGSDEGKGPFRKLVIRGATLIDGTGAEPRGPVDIVVSNNRVTKIRDVDQAELGQRRAPFDADHEVDATGQYVLPGFVDLHVHAGEPPKNP